MGRTAVVAMKGFFAPGSATRQVRNMFVVVSKCWPFSVTEPSVWIPSNSSITAAPWKPAKNGSN